jgi:hypothetical protein
MPRLEYERVPIKDSAPRGSFTLPRDVIRILGDGDPEIGNLVLLDTFGVHPMSAPLGAIHPDAVRDLGHGNAAAGRKVLQKFVTMIRKQKAA